MTGPEHYREAERLLERGTAESITEADVHATLALAAATALMHDDDSTMPEDFTAWREAAGAPAYTGPEAVNQ